VKAWRKGAAKSGTLAHRLQQILAFPTTATGLNFWRFVSGLGIGLEMATIGTYTSSISFRGVALRASWRSIKTEGPRISPEMPPNIRTPISVEEILVAMLSSICGRRQTGSPLVSIDDLRRSLDSPLRTRPKQPLPGPFLKADIVVHKSLVAAVRFDVDQHRECPLLRGPDGSETSAYCDLSRACFGS
jgi:hypothetical protein